ncbi:nucleotidyltransferase family protein [Yunchengibacter salinarum]|uniref:nucleotidyltransferase family protein n=1 Tax=Yunchengibacter salinarum TaxID=3133399 RepID=UPI0035B59F80
MKPVTPPLALAFLMGEAPEDGQGQWSGSRAAALWNWAGQQFAQGEAAHAWHARGHGPVPPDQLAETMRAVAPDQRMVLFELDRVAQILVPEDVSFVVLKGGAHAALGAAAGFGRRVSDLDILVDPADLRRAEAALHAAGWMIDSHAAGAYDQHYYRQHMHELPPLRHEARGTLLDVHFRLTPRRGRIRVDHEAMMAAAIPLPGWGGAHVRVFTPVDRFLHAALHHLGDGQMDTPVRRVLELAHLFDSLDPEDRAALPARAEQVGLARVHKDAMALLALFGRRRHTGHPVRCVPRLARARFAATIPGAGPGYRLAGWVAAAVLWGRAHWLRMPLLALARHAAVKLARRLRP